MSMIDLLVLSCLVVCGTIAVMSLIFGISYVLLGLFEKVFGNIEGL